MNYNFNDDLHFFSMKCVRCGGTKFDCSYNGFLQLTIAFYKCITTYVSFYCVEVVVKICWNGNTQLTLCHYTTGQRVVMYSNSHSRQVVDIVYMLNGALLRGKKNPESISY